MTTLTFDQILASARQLAPHERAELIARLARELAEQPTVAPPADGWTRWQQLRTEIATLYPHADIGGRLDADRRERDDMLAGREAADDVHSTN
jgi:hypothetical protein